MFGLKTSRNGRSTETFLKRVMTGDIYSDLERFGQQGVDALANATPRDTGKTAQSWRYRVIKSSGGIFGIAWYNDNEVDGNNIAILIQYGHGTGTGGFVQGRDYINPATQVVFDKISEEIWKRVKAS